MYVSEVRNTACSMKRRACLSQTLVDWKGRLVGDLKKLCRSDNNIQLQDIWDCCMIQTTFSGPKPNRPKQARTPWAWRTNGALSRGGRRCFSATRQRHACTSMDTPSNRGAAWRTRICLLQTRCSPCLLQGRVAVRSCAGEQICGYLECHCWPANQWYIYMDKFVSLPYIHTS